MQISNKIGVLTHLVYLLVGDSFSFTLEISKFLHSNVIPVIVPEVFLESK